MAIIPDLEGSGEFGATVVLLTKDGTSYRLAFGRSGSAGPVFHGAAILSKEAAEDLKRQILALEIP